jgi:SAM-dependent MidA family methyltransferase
MEKALYDPDHGFYATGRTRTGKTGDFLTPVSPGPVLGELLARQADELHETLGRPKVIRLIEQGADRGELARDLVNAALQNHPQLARAAELHLIEPHPPLAKTQQETLGQPGIKIRWHRSWEAVPATETACFFYSSELVDSFPVRIFTYRNRTWRERLVGLGPSGFEWQEGEAGKNASAEILGWEAPATEGFTMELRPAASSWVESWTQKIPAGLALTMDYGFLSRELYSPGRSGGTLMAFREHHRSQDPLADPGQQDLTAHVNFTELENLVTRAGWKNYGLTDFAHGLTALAVARLMDQTARTESWIRNFRHLTHPSFFGQSHKILVQGKSLPTSYIPSVLGKL